MSKRRARTRGFSLLEVVVALAILGAAFAVLFGGLSQSVRSVERVGRSDLRLESAKNLLSKLALISLLRADDQARGRFDDGTLWEVRTAYQISPTDTNRSALLRITLRFEWQTPSGSQERQLETYRFVRTVSPDAPALEVELDKLR